MKTVKRKTHAHKKCPNCKRKLDAPTHNPTPAHDYSQSCKCGLILHYMETTNGLFLHRFTRPE